MGAQAELGGLERVRLGHRDLGPIQAIEDELAEERVADFPGQREMLLALAIDEEELIAARLARDIDVFSQLDIATRAEDQRPPIAPCAEACRRVPIDAEIIRRAVVGDEVRVAVVLQLGIIGTRIIRDRGLHHRRILRAGVEKKLLNLVAADVAQNPAIFRALDKGGWRSSDTAELVFENCRIPAGNLLGEENRGFYSVMKNFQTERIALGAMAIGHCTQALRITLEHVRERMAFGAPLFDKQVVRQKLAMLDAKTRAARAFTYHCAWRVTQGHDVVQEVSMLKALTGELVNEVVSGCQQFHGGMGYMRGTVIERLWRDARILAIGGGATEVMLDEVAKRY